MKTKVEPSERSMTDGSEKEPNYYLLLKENTGQETDNPDEIAEPFVLLSRDFSSNEIALVYHYKTSHR